MKEITTIKAYIKLIKEIEKIPPSFLKGFDKLPVEKQELILLLSADISNNINEY